MRFFFQTKFDISFLDFLFNLLTVFVIIAIIAVIHMNPPTKKADAPKKAEFLITVEWTKKSDNDIDVWLDDGELKPLSFRNKQKAPFFLDRDDTGTNIDSYITSTGEIKSIPINREVITSRGWPENGVYYVNLHLYNKRDKEIDDSIEVTIVSLNPYKLIYNRTVTILNNWEEKDLVSFEIYNSQIIELTDDHKYFYVQDHLDRLNKSFQPHP